MIAQRWVAWGALWLLLATGAGWAARQEGAPGLQAAAPTMPLLSSWVRALHEGGAPAAYGSRQRLVKGGICDFDSDQVAIMGFQARRYQHGQDTACTLLYDDWRLDKKYPGGRPVFLYWRFGKPVPPSWDPTQREVDLVGSKGAALGISATSPAAIEAVRIVPGQAALTLSPVHDEGSLREIRSILLVTTPMKEDQVIVERLLSGQRVAYLPDELTSADAKSRPAARQTASGLLLAGIEWGKGNSEHLVWCSRGRRDARWNVQRLLVDRSYLSSIMPRALPGARLDYEIDQQVHLWKDGSIIFLLGCSYGESGDQMRARFIIRQPRKGRGQVLAWEVLYNFTYMPGEDSPGQDNSKDLATLSTAWWCAEGGAIASAYFDTSWTNELWFDVDPVNDCVLYLRGGELWSTTVQ